MRTNRRKVVLSGAAHHTNEAAGAGYFAASGGETAETGLVGGGKWIRTVGTGLGTLRRQPSVEFHNMLNSSPQGEASVSFAERRSNHRRGPVCRLWSLTEFSHRLG
jgi:hypothetical protein